MEGTHRNQPCPCGSGKKYKNCCMKRLHNKSRDELIKDKKGALEMERVRMMPPDQRARYEIKKKREKNDRLESIELDRVGEAEMIKRDKRLMLIELRALVKSVEIDVRMLKENLALLDETRKEIEALPLSLRKRMVLDSYDMQRQGIVDKIDNTVVYEQNRVVLRMLEAEFADEQDKD